jgi:hypothetical protein
LALRRRMLLRRPMTFDHRCDAAHDVRFNTTEHDAVDRRRPDDPKRDPPHEREQERQLDQLQPGQYDAIANDRADRRDPEQGQRGPPPRRPEVPTLGSGVQADAGKRQDVATIASATKNRSRRSTAAPRGSGPGGASTLGGGQIRTLTL